MKKTILATLGIIAILSICLAGTVSATKAGYVLENVSGTEITADGTAAAGEWSDAFGDWLYDGWTKTTSTIFTKWEMGGTPNIADQYKIEVLSDTTNDAGDTFTFSWCGARDGAATPQAADDVKIVFTRTTTTISRGTGTGWAVDPAIVLGTNVFIASSMASGHWVIELKFDKGGSIVGSAMDSDVRLAAYDATTGKTLMWPPNTSADVPNDWGTIDYTNFTGTTVPEGLTIGVMLALSSVAAVVSIRYFRKPMKL